MARTELTNQQIATLASQAASLTKEWSELSGREMSLAFEELLAVAEGGIKLLTRFDEELEAEQEAADWETCEDDLDPGEVRCPEMTARARELLSPVVQEGFDFDTFVGFLGL